MDSSLKSIIRRCMGNAAATKTRATKDKGVARIDKSNDLSPRALHNGAISLDSNEKSTCPPGMCEEQPFEKSRSLKQPIVLFL